MSGRVMRVWMDGRDPGVWPIPVDPVLASGEVEIDLSDIEDEEPTTSVSVRTPTRPIPGVLLEGILTQMVSEDVDAAFDALIDHG